MKRSNDFIVGLVVLVSVLIIGGTTIWLSNAHFGRKQEHVFARVRNVGNARVGNSVVIRGVESGRIDRIELADDGWVVMRMALDKDTQLPRDPVVILNESSMFGDWQATIMDRSTAPANREVQEQLADPGATKEGAIPGATLPDIAQLTAVAGRIAGDVATVAGRFQVAFDERAARELRQSIRNVSDLSSELAQTVRLQSKNLDHIASDVHATVASINATSDALQRTALRVDSSTSTGELRQIVGNINEASQDIRATSARLRSSAERLAQTEDHLDRVLAQSDSVMTKINGGEGSLGLLVNNPSLYRNSDSLVTQMRELVAEIKSHPKRYLSLRVF